MFREFHAEYAHFLREAVCSDFDSQDEVAKLLRYETSAVELSSFDEYISRSPPEQSKIYYLIAPNKDLAAASPYYEAFKAAGVEVLFLYSTVDEFVMNNVREYNGRPLVSVELEQPEDALLKESAATDAADETKSGGASEDGSAADSSIDSADIDATALVGWLKQSLGDRVSDVVVTCV